MYVYPEVYHVILRVHTSLKIVKQERLSILANILMDLLDI